MTMKRQGPTSATIDVGRRVAAHRVNTIVAGQGKGQDVTVQSTSRPLSNFIQPSTLRTCERYDWKTGKVIEEKADVVSHAKRQMGTNKSMSVTSNRGNNKQKKSDHSDHNGMCAPCSPYGSDWGY